MQLTKKKKTSPSNEKLFHYNGTSAYLPTSYSNCVSFGGCLGRGRRVWKSGTGDLGHATVAAEAHGGGGVRAHHGLTLVET